MKTKNYTHPSRRSLRLALMLAVMLMTMAAKTSGAQYSVSVTCQYYDNGIYREGTVGGTAGVSTATTLGTSTTVSTSIEVPSGMLVTITATPAAGYKFKEWAIISGNTPLAFSPNQATTSFLMPSSSLELVAKFDNCFVVNTTANPSNGGTVQVSTDNTNWEDRLTDIQSGTKVYYCCSPYSGYMFSSVDVTPYEGAVSSSSIGTGSFTMPANNVMVTINFAEDPTAFVLEYPSVLSDNKDFTNDYATALNGQTATYNRNYTKGVASTLCLPFGISSAYVSHVGKLYAFGGVNDSRTEVTMADATASIDASANYPSCIPYLFIPDVDGTVTFSGGTSLSNIIPGSVVKGDWSFRGTFSKIEWKTDPVNIYGFASGEAYGGSGDATAAGTFIRVHTGGIRPYRAYLEYKDNSARSVTRGAADELPETMTVRLVNANGETTAIGTLDTRTGEFSFPDGQSGKAGRSQWFTLDGRRLAGPPSQKGVYIRNGRKEVGR